MSSSLHPKQLLPAVGNGSPSTISTTFFKGQTYVAYCKGESVIVLGELLQTIQVVKVPSEFRSPGAEEEIRGVVFNKKTSEMAVRSGTRVFLFVVQPTQVASKSLTSKVGAACQWVFDSYIETGNAVTAFCWCEKRNELVICGKFVSVWSIPPETLKKGSKAQSDRANGQSLMKCTWKTKLAKETEHCSCSPDGRFFCTASASDRLLKIWFSSTPPAATSAADMYTSDLHVELLIKDVLEVKYTNMKPPLPVLPPTPSFLFRYLQLPGPLSSVHWLRLPSAESDSDQYQNVLLTTTGNCDATVWAEIDDSGRFSMCGVIPCDPRENHEFSWLSLPSSPVTRPSSSASSFHPPATVDEAVSLYFQARKQALTVKGRGALASGWLLEVKGSQNVVVWQIKDIALQAHKHHHLPSFEVAFRTRVSKAAAQESIKFLCGVYGGSSSSPTSSLSSALDLSNLSASLRDLKLYVATSDGSISSWSLAVDPVARSSNFLRLSGHQHAAHMIESHPVLPLVTTVDRDSSRLIVWTVPSTDFLDPVPLLKDIGSMTLALPISCWAPDSPLLFVAQHNSPSISCFLISHSSLLSFDDSSSLSSRASSPSSPEIKAIGSVHLEKESSSARSLSVLQIKAFRTTNKPFQYRIASVQDNGLRLRIWKVSVSSPLSAESLITCKVEFEQEFDAKRRVSFCNLNDLSSLSSVFPSDPKLFPPWSLMLGHWNGEVSLWSPFFPSDNKKEEKEKKNKWREVGKYKAHDRTVMWVEGLGGSLIATGSVQEPKRMELPPSGNKSPSSSSSSGSLVGSSGKVSMSSAFITQPASKEVKIWSTATASPLLSLQSLFTTEGSDECPLCVSSLPLSVDSFILAIGHNKSLTLTVQSNRVPLSGKQSWFAPARARYDLPARCLSLSWVPSSKILIVSCEDGHCYNFTRWNVISPLHQPLPFEASSHMIQQACLLSSGLPYFHPTHIAERLVRAQFSCISSLLLHFLQSLESSISRSSSIKGFLIRSIEPLPLDLLIKTFLPEDELTAPPAKTTPAVQNSSVSSFFAPTSISSFAPPSSSGSLFAPKSLFAPSSISFAPEPVSFSSSDIDKQNEKEEEEKKKEKEEFASERDALTDEQIARLDEILELVSVVGLSATDLTYLRAVIKTFKTIRRLKEGIDLCAVRFLTAVLLFRNTKDLAESGYQYTLSSEDFAWALHSDSQEAILRLCLPEEEFTWENLQALGVGFWMTKPAIVRTTAEIIAKQEYLKNKQPEECALWYVALGKKGVLQSLFKSCGNAKVSKTLENDFSQEKWASAAIRTAYALLGRQQYHYAASFLLLGSDQKSALNILIRNANDCQLALFISRLVCSESSPLPASVLNDHLIPHAKDSADLFLESICLWLLRKYDDSIATFHRSPSKTTPPTSSSSSSSSSSSFMSSFSPSPFSMSGGGGAGRSLFAPRSGLEMMSGEAKEEKEEEKVKNMLGDEDKHAHNKIRHHSASSLFYLRHVCGLSFINKDLTDEQELSLMRQAFDYYQQLGCSTMALELVSRLFALQDRLISAAQSKRKEASSSSSSSSSSSGFDDDPYGGFFGGGGFGMGGMIRAAPIVSAPVVEAPKKEEEKKEETKEPASFEEAIQIVTLQTITSRVMLQVVSGWTAWFSVSGEWLQDMVEWLLSNTKSIKIDRSHLIQRIQSYLLDATNFISFAVDLEPLAHNEKKKKIQNTDSSSSSSSSSDQGDQNAPHRLPEEVLQSFPPAITKIEALTPLDGSHKISESAVLGPYLQGVMRTLDGIGRGLTEWMYSPISVSQLLHFLTRLSQVLDLMAHDQLPLPADPSSTHKTELLELFYKTSVLLLFYARQYDTVHVFLQLKQVSQLCSEESRKALKTSIEILRGNQAQVQADLTKRWMIEHDSWETDDFPSERFVSRAVLVLLLKRISNVVRGKVYSSPSSSAHPIRPASHSTPSHINAPQGHLHRVNGNPHIPQTSSSSSKPKETSAPSDDRPGQPLHSASFDLWCKDKEAQLDGTPVFKCDLSQVKLLKVQQSVDMMTEVMKYSMMYESRAAMDLWRSLHLEFNEIIGRHPLLASNISDCFGSKSVSSVPMRLYNIKDIIYSFCSNPVNPSQVVLCTAKRIFDIEIPSDPPIPSSVTCSSRSLSRSTATSLAIAGEPTSLPGGNSSPHPGQARSKEALTHAKDALSFAKAPVVTMESHPTLPLFLTGSITGSVHLWNFQSSDSVRCYHSGSGSSSRVTNVHWSPSGTKFGCTTNSGLLMLWSLSQNPHPFTQLVCHAKRAHDFVFVTSNVLATGGTSQSHGGSANVAMWDVLMPPQKNRIASFNVHQEGGCSTLQLIPDSQVLVGGGKKGDLTFMDLRQQRLLHTIPTAHEGNITSLSLTSNPRFLVSGSSDGHIKIWDLDHMSLVDTWINSHERQTVVSDKVPLSEMILTKGVMAVKGGNTGAVFSCGSDGRLVRRFITRT